MGPPIKYHAINALCEEVIVMVTKKPNNRPHFGKYASFKYSDIGKVKKSYLPHTSAIFHYFRAILFVHTGNFREHRERFCTYMYVASS